MVIGTYHENRRLEKVPLIFERANWNENNEQHIKKVQRSYTTAMGRQAMEFQLDASQWSMAGRPPSNSLDLSIK